jgi:hypothetical protein
MTTQNRFYPTSSKCGEVRSRHVAHKSFKNTNSGLENSLKGHEIFSPRFFLLNCTPGSPDTLTKTVLHIDSNSPRYSTMKIDSALCCIVQSRDSPLGGIARSRLPAVPLSAESTVGYTWLQQKMAACYHHA